MITKRRNPFFWYEMKWRSIGGAMVIVAIVAAVLLIKSNPDAAPVGLCGCIIMFFGGIAILADN